LRIAKPEQNGTVGDNEEGFIGIDEVRNQVAATELDSSSTVAGDARRPAAVQVAYGYDDPKPGEWPSRAGSHNRGRVG